MRGLVHLVEPFITFVVLLPFVCALLSPGLLIAGILGKRWHKTVDWRLAEFLLVVPPAAVWYWAFGHGGRGHGKTWGNFLLELFVLGFSAVIYVVFRRYCCRGAMPWWSYPITVFLCCAAAVVVDRSVPMIPFPE